MNKNETLSPEPGDLIKMRDNIIGDSGNRKVDLSGVIGHLLKVWVEDDGTWSAEAYLIRKGNWLILGREADVIRIRKRQKS